MNLQKDFYTIIKNENENKLTLIETNDNNEIITFLNAIDFRSSEKITRISGEVYKVKFGKDFSFEFTFEKIKGLGYTSEIELHSEDIQNNNKLSAIIYFVKELEAIAFTKPLFGEYLTNKMKLS